MNNGEIMRQLIRFSSALALLFATAGNASANFIYHIQNYPSQQNNYSLAGTITTDINSGVLNESDIIAWSISMTDGTAMPTTYSYDSTMANTSVHVIGNGLLVTPNEITLAQPGSNTNDFYFQIGIRTPLFYSNAPSGTLYASVTPTVGALWDTHPSISDLGGNPWVIAKAEPSAVPEPSSFALLGLGGLSLAISAYRRRWARTAA